MSAHYCHAIDNNGYMGELDDRCCYKIAHFQLWKVWFCAEHYDQFIIIDEDIRAGLIGSADIEDSTAMTKNGGTHELREMQDRLV